MKGPTGQPALTGIIAIIAGAYHSFALNRPAMIVLVSGATGAGPAIL